MLLHNGSYSDYMRKESSAWLWCSGKSQKFDEYNRKKVERYYYHKGKRDIPHSNIRCSEVEKTA